ncbi:MAG: hypothetical protein LBC20_16100 [Planctomycetaceae bacterium]|jgi:hypothetical protein|nr:hypothetical protein [Planctomycetaceae bacterium]
MLRHLNKRENCRYHWFVHTAAAVFTCYIIASTKQTVSGEGLTVESAVLNVVKNVSGLSIQLTKTELIG